MLKQTTQGVCPRTSQRAENGGLDPSWLDLAFLGRPDCPFRAPKTLENKDLGTSGLKSGHPKKNGKSNHDGSNPPFFGPLKRLTLAVP